MVAYRSDGMHMWHVESVAVAREYACSENGKKREAAAGSTLTPAAYLGRLIHDRVSYVRNAASENPKTPVCDLVAYASAVLAGEVGGALSDVAAGNSALPGWFVGDAVIRAVQEAERAGRKSVPFSVYRLIEESPNLPESVMVWLVEGGDRGMSVSSPTCRRVPACSGCSLPSRIGACAAMSPTVWTCRRTYWPRSPTMRRGACARQRSRARKCRNTCMTM